MRKIWVVAAREYMAAVRTKAFLIGLLLMPILMGASAVLQYLLRDVVDVSAKEFAVIDRTPGAGWAEKIVQGVEKWNASAVVDGKRLKPPFKVEVKTAEEDAAAQRFALSERVRKGELLGFLEVTGGDPLRPATGKKGEPEPPVTLTYYTDRPTYLDFAQLAEGAVTKGVQQAVTKGKLDSGQLAVLLRPVAFKQKGLQTRDEATGQFKEATEQSRAAAVAVPIGLMMLMFMIILMGATPLMQGVIEEKMQRIAEVLLGSVRPFELMSGKLLGMTAVTLTISAVYLAGGWWASNQFGFAEYVSAELLLWFLVFQALAALMFGSLFIAVGAACTDMKEAQNLIWPVTLMAAIPMFLLGNVVREPNSPVALGMSFFPFATPTMMVARMGVPPGIPSWQPAVGVVIVLATTLLCVYAAGRIFRVGILLQGKGARVGDIVRWVFRG